MSLLLVACVLGSFFVKETPCDDAAKRNALKGLWAVCAVAVGMASLTARPAMKLVVQILALGVLVPLPFIFETDLLVESLREKATLLTAMLGTAALIFAGWRSSVKFERRFAGVGRVIAAVSAMAFLSLWFWPSLDSEDALYRIVLDASHWKSMPLRFSGLGLFLLFVVYSLTGFVYAFNTRSRRSLNLQLGVAALTWLVIASLAPLDFNDDLFDHGSLTSCFFLASILGVGGLFYGSLLDFLPFLLVTSDQLRGCHEDLPSVRDILAKGSSFWKSAAESVGRLIKTSDADDSGADQIGDGANNEPRHAVFDASGDSSGSVQGLKVARAKVSPNADNARKGPLIIGAMLILLFLIGIFGDALSDDTPSWTSDVFLSDYDEDRWIFPAGKSKDEIENAAVAIWNRKWERNSKGPKIMFIYDDSSLARKRSGPWILRLQHMGDDLSKFSDPKLSWRPYPRPFKAADWARFEQFCDWEESFGEGIDHRQRPSVFAKSYGLPVEKTAKMINRISAWWFKGI